MPAYKDSKIYLKKEDNQAKMTKNLKESSPQMIYKYSSLKKPPNPNLKTLTTKENETNLQPNEIPFVPKITLNLITDILPFINDVTSPIKKPNYILHDNHYNNLNTSLNYINRLFS